MAKSISYILTTTCTSEADTVGDFDVRQIQHHLFLSINSRKSIHVGVITSRKSLYWFLSSLLYVKITKKKLQRSAKET